jgi:hypothetical protein
VGYAEGALRPDSSGLERRDHAVGHALLGVSIAPGVDVAVGPQARAYLWAADRARWLSWIVRVGFEAPIIARVIRGYAAGWGAVSGEAGMEALFDGGRGGAVGLRLNPARAVGLRLEYAIEETSLRSPVHKETVEGVTVGVCLGC